MDRLGGRRAEARIRPEFADFRRSGAAFAPPLSPRLQSPRRSRSMLLLLLTKRHLEATQLPSRILTLSPMNIL
jgi:hypothetical protein